MENNFNLKKFLIENKLTLNSKLLSKEEVDSHIELSASEINFISNCIELYWENYNYNHEDNLANRLISDELIKKLK